jgi:hypothetical protein
VIIEAVMHAVGPGHAVGTVDVPAAGTWSFSITVRIS